jgi:hypothetical protein
VRSAPKAVPLTASERGYGFSLPADAGRIPRRASLPSQRDLGHPPPLTRPCLNNETASVSMVIVCRCIEEPGHSPMGARHRTRHTLWFDPRLPSMKALLSSVDSRRKVDHFLSEKLTTPEGVTV